MGRGSGVGLEGWVGSRYETKLATGFARFKVAEHRCLEAA